MPMGEINLKTETHNIKKTQTNTTKPKISFMITNVGGLLKPGNNIKYRNQLGK